MKTDQKRSIGKFSDGAGESEGILLLPKPSFRCPSFPFGTGRFFCVLLGACLAGLMQAQTISNPGFEDDLTDWKSNFDYDMSHASIEAAKTGSHGLRVWDDSATQGSGLESFPGEAIAGKKYEVTFWARIVSGEGGLSVSLRFLDENEKRLEKVPPSVRVMKTPEWKEFSVSGVAPAGAVAFIVRVESSPSETATIDLDDFAVRTAE